MARATTTKQKVYIVIETDYIDSVWSNVDDAIARRDTLNDQGKAGNYADFTIITRTVR